MKILIVYYSWSGKTRKMAETIHALVGGNIVEIEPEKPYPSSYRETVNQVRREMIAGYKPPIKTRVANFTEYDLIFLGSPNWWRTLALPVVSFIEGHNFSGKKIAPFFTHGGGGMQRMLEDLKKLCPNSEILSPLVVYEGGGPELKEKVEKWLKKIEKEVKK